MELKIFENLLIETDRNGKSKDLYREKSFYKVPHCRVDNVNYSKKLKGYVVNYNCLPRTDIEDEVFEKASIIKKGFGVFSVKHHPTSKLTGEKTITVTFLEII